jgi:hypothetical protein
MSAAFNPFARHMVEADPNAEAAAQQAPAGIHLPDMKEPAAGPSPNKSP